MATKKTEKQNESQLAETNAAPIVAIDTSSFSNILDTVKFDHLWRVAKTFADSDLVPTHFRQKPSNCFIVLNMAVRLEVDPFMFMQNTYVVHGKIGMEAKLAIALVNSRGPFKGPIQWRFDGEGKDQVCTAYAFNKETGDICEASVSWEMVEKEGWSSNSKWSSMPEQMFKYRSATFLARLYAPECLIGMQTEDELIDVDGPNIAPEIEPPSVEDALSKPVVKAKVVLSEQGKKNPDPVETEIVETKQKKENDFFGDL